MEKGISPALAQGNKEEQVKSELSQFAETVHQVIAKHFSVPIRSFFLIEHSTHDFIASDIWQHVHHKETVDPWLRWNRESVTDAAEFEEQAKKSGLHGLTKEEGGVNRIVHVLTQSRLANTKCTLIHEALHAYSNNAFGARYGKDLDEGVTEYLALEIINSFPKLGKARSQSKVYKDETELAKHFISKYGYEHVKTAYFLGIFHQDMPTTVPPVNEFRHVPKADTSDAQEYQKDAVYTAMFGSEDD